MSIETLAQVWLYSGKFITVFQINSVISAPSAQSAKIGNLGPSLWFYQVGRICCPKISYGFSRSFAQMHVHRCQDSLEHLDLNCTVIMLVLAVVAVGDFGFWSNKSLIPSEFRSFGVLKLDRPSSISAHANMSGTNGRRTHLHGTYCIISTVQSWQTQYVDYVCKQPN